jgi:AcrR family transcriptional regulator
MSPRKPAAQRSGHSRDLREHLIATAARLIAQRGTAGLAVRDIAREAQVADGVLYNYFEDKDDLLAQALLAHVGSVMASRAPAPQAGNGTVAENLRLFIEGGVRTLSQVAPAFVGLISQPGALVRFHSMVGGDSAFGADMPGPDADADAGRRDAADPGGPDPGQPTAGPADSDHGAPGQRGLPDILRGYLATEQRIGRIDRDADIEAAVTLIVGTIHGEVLPRVLFRAPDSEVPIPADLAGRITATVLSGIAPRPRD